VNEQVFDLRSVATRARRAGLPARVLGSFGAAVFVLGATYRLLAQPGSTFSLELAVIALAGAAGMLSVVLCTGRYPSFLRIDAEGFSFSFAFEGAHARTFDWTDPALKLSFNDSRYRPEAIEHPESFGCLLSVNLSLVWLHACPLTEEAYQSLLHSAETHGLRIQPGDWSGPTSGRRIVVLSSVGSQL
jgi:hypothetical protein